MMPVKFCEQPSMLFKRIANIFPFFHKRASVTLSVKNLSFLQILNFGVHNALTAYLSQPKEIHLLNTHRIQTTCSIIIDLHEAA